MRVVKDGWAVTGKDLITAGMKPGKEIGQMLEHFLDLVLEHPELNQKEELFEADRVISIKS